MSDALLRVMPFTMMQTWEAAYVIKYQALSTEDSIVKTYNTVGFRLCVGMSFVCENELDSEQIQSTLSSALYTLTFIT